MSDFLDSLSRRASGALDGWDSGHALRPRTRGLFEPTPAAALPLAPTVEPWPAEPAAPLEDVNNAEAPPRRRRRAEDARTETDGPGPEVLRPQGDRALTPLQPARPRHVAASAPLQPARPDPMPPPPGTPSATSASPPTPTLPPALIPARCEPPPAPPDLRPAPRVEAHPGSFDALLNAPTPLTTPARRGVTPRLMTPQPENQPPLERPIPAGSQPITPLERPEPPTEPQRGALEPPARPNLIARLGTRAPEVSPAPTAAPAPAAAPTVNVMIGRIEVRATPSAGSTARKPTGPSVMSLDEYLRRRNGGGD